MSIIKDKIKQYKKIQSEKNIYSIKNLYCGQIEQLLYVSESKTAQTTTVIKRFAIFYKKSHDSYIHIKSNLTLKDIHDTKVGNYGIVNIVPFTKTSDETIKQQNLNHKSKLSKEDIALLECSGNKQFEYLNHPYEELGF